MNYETWNAEASGIDHGLPVLFPGRAVESSTDNPLPIQEIVRFMQDKVISDYSSLLLAARSDQEKKRQLKRLIGQLLLSEGLVGQRIAREAIAEEVTNEIVGFGPIEPPISDIDVTEIMVNNAQQVFVERNGQIEPTAITFRDNEHVMEVIRRIIAPLGRRLDQLSPFVDARLPNGSRIHAVIPPVSPKGPVVTIRKFPRNAFGADDLVRVGSLSEDMRDFLELCVRSSMNIVVSGGASSGKTTMLNVLSSFIPNERIITIEDSLELQLHQSHVISLEARPPNTEGKGEVTIRDLVRNALRMRPDRLVIGEVRGAEAFDMLQALNTGHSGSMSTVHANSPSDALLRLESMALMSGEALTAEAMRYQIHSAIDLVIHQSRLPDGKRITSCIAMVTKPDENCILINDRPRISVVFQSAVDHTCPERQIVFRRNASVRFHHSFRERARAAGLQPLTWMEFE